MELGRVWHVGVVEVSQTPFARLGRMDEEEEEKDSTSWILDLDKEVFEPLTPFLGAGIREGNF